jgi:hypothetical protein
VRVVTDSKDSICSRTDTYIRKIIVERAVRGELKLGERINPGQERKPCDRGNRRLVGQTIKCYPEMISEATWQAANDALASRRKTGGAHAPEMVNLFGGGLTVCQCGTRMRLKSKGLKGAHRYLQCAAAKRGLCSNRLYFNYQRIETQILKVFGAAAFRVGDQSEQQATMRERIAAVRHEADELAAEYQAANRIARKNPGPLAEASLAELQAEHGAKLKLVADLELAYRKIATEPRDQQLVRAWALIDSIDTLTGDARVALRTKLNSDLRQLFDAIIFRGDGRVMLKAASSPLTDDARFITICEPPDDAECLTTAEEVLAALKAGHEVGMAAPKPSP